MPEDAGYPDGTATSIEEETRPIGKKISDAEEQMIIKHVMGIKSESEQYYAGRRSKWLDYFHHYINKKRHRTRTTIPVPLASETVDVTLSEMVTRQFASKPFCSVRARKDEDQGKALAVEMLLQYQFEEMGIFDVFYQIAKSTLIYGSAPFKICYDEDIIEVPIPGTPFEHRTLRFSGPRIFVYDIFDYFPDASKVRVDDAAPQVWRSYRPYEYLEERKDNYPTIYRNINKIPHKRQANLQTDDLDARTERQSSLGMSPESTARGLIEILECDCWWPFQKSDGVWVQAPHVFTIANGKLIRAERNNYIAQDANGGLAIIDRIPNDLYGLGLIEKMHPQIHGANTALDMMLTNLELTVDKKIVVDTTRVKKEHELSNGAGGVIHSKGPVGDAVKWFDGGSIVPDIAQTMAMFLSFGESASNVKPPQKGVSAEHTATAATLSARQSGVSFNLFMMMLENTFVKEAASRMHKINQQFLDLPMVFPILGGDQTIAYQQIDKETIAISPDFVPEGSMRELNKEINIAQIEKFLMIVSKIEALFPIIPKMIGKLAHEFRWQDADQIQQLSEQAIEQALFIKRLQEQAQLEAQQAQTEAVGQQPTSGGGQSGERRGTGVAMNQIADHDNSSGVNATNQADLLRSIQSEFGASAFSG
jgi:hypothetical protein